MGHLARETAIVIVNTRNSYVLHTQKKSYKLVHEKHLLENGKTGKC